MFPLKILLLTALCVRLGDAQISPFQAILQFYKQQGLQFKEDKFNNNGPILEEYDFVVVGSSPSGCVLTNRLTENPRWKVLLLEAGIDGSIYTDVPTLSTYFLHTEYNWNFKTEKSPYACLGLKDKMCPWPAGKAVGGGSIINALIYTRGMKRDFERWRNLGNEGWGYDDVLPYFLKSEDIRVPWLRNSPYHANQGNLTVGYAPFTTGAFKYFLEAGRELGYPFNDYNGADPIGFSQIQSTIRNGRRVSGAKAFLTPIKNRRNFHISQNSRVTRILIDPVTKRAYGVEFRKDNRLRKVLARNEVILAAGTFMSPFLLMHSGVGPEEHLSELGIPVIQNLRVGDNLQEHLTMAGLTFLTNDSSLTVDIPGEVIPRLPVYFTEWYTRGTGILTDVGCEGLAYVKTPLADAEDYPDVELIFLGISGFATDRGHNLRTGMAVTDEIYTKTYRPIEGKPGWTMWPMPSLLRSRGFVRLYNRNPLDQPKITHNFFTDPYDIDVMVEGIKWIIRISQTRAFQKIGTRLHDIPIPGCENIPFATDPYWACMARHLTNQLHHASGTCKMGPDSDPAAVVDSRLRVRGVEGLRVVDCSIIPVITTGHTMAPAYMIGEKASDMIKEDWGFFG
uniref:Glucose-methanol-choline oxidoreductase N-terminal domain-containing protein n=1 Tax=Graphocephala atropunctata TaxID=36148 RepID=A0A1B6MEC3_9HEMI